MKLRILCIDDSKSVHAFLKDCVTEVSVNFQSKFDGEQGLQALSESPQDYDCVFLDWEMPKKTGPEVLVEARKLGFKAPIVMLTSKNQMEDIASMIKNGATEYIMKPFTKDIILERLKMIFGEELRK